MELIINHPFLAVYTAMAIVSFGLMAICIFKARKGSDDDNHLGI